VCRLSVNHRLSEWEADWVTDCDWREALIAWIPDADRGDGIPDWLREAWGVRRELSDCVNWGVSWLTAWIECLNPWLIAWGVSWVTVWGADWVSERLARLSGKWSLEAVGRRESRDSEETVSWVRDNWRERRRRWEFRAGLGYARGERLCRLMSDERERFRIGESRV
jgi:hypothetical protein